MGNKVGLLGVKVRVALHGGLKLMIEGDSDGQFAVTTELEEMTVADLVRNIGLPLEEIGISVVNGEVVRLHATIRDGDSVAFYPILVNG